MADKYVSMSDVIPWMCLATGPPVIITYPHDTQKAKAMMRYNVININPSM